MAVAYFRRLYSMISVRQTKAFEGTSQSRHSSSTNTSDLSKRAYWETFYAKSTNKHFEWFLGYEDLKEHILAILEQYDGEAPKILEIGCGTSKLSFHIFSHLKGRCFIDGIDYSEEAIKIMNSNLELFVAEENSFSLSKDLSKISFHVANACSLPFDENLFHLTIDKGTIDAILRAKHGEGLALKTLAENVRVLRNGGTIIQVSDEGPECRMELLDMFVKTNSNSCLSTTCKHLGCFQGIEYFFYTIKKNSLC